MTDNILLCEDDNAIRMAMTLYLEDRGYHVQEAGNGQAGIEMLQTHSFDAVIADLRMPLASGFQVLRTIKRDTPETPILLMSGTGDINDVVDGLRLGAADFILKPIMDMNILEHSLKNCLERSRLQKENQRQKALLQAANKELESFNYSVSHDLRSPLNAVLAFSEFIEDEARDTLNEDCTEYLARIKSAAARMTDMIDSLLSLSRLNSSDLVRETVDVTQMAQEVFREIATDFQSTPTAFSVEAGIRMHADKKLLRHVLENLIGNAWKYTRKTTSPRIDITATHTSHDCTVHIADNGAGFNPKHQNRLFSVFQRLHSEKHFPGNGVGLATVRRIVNRHRGSVSATGEIDRGATFAFTIPYE